MKNKKLTWLIILCAIFVLFLTLSLLGKFVFGWFDEKEDEPYVAPELLDGEAYYYLGSVQMKDSILMFPQVSRSQVFEIRVHNAAGENYYFLHEQSGSNNYFLLGQSEDEDFEITDEGLYYPEIISEFGSTFDYTSLYDDTSTIPAMLAAVGCVVINERIFPDEETGWTEEWLSHYGLAKENNPAYFEVIPYLYDKNGNYVYTDTTSSDANLIVIDTSDGSYRYLTSEGELGDLYTGSTSSLTPAADTDETYRVYVGLATADDQGYYIYLEGRNIVYTTQSAYLNSIVERDISYYVAPRLVTESESNYAHTFTPYISIEKGNYVTEDGYVLTEEDTVAINVDTIWTHDNEQTTDTEKNQYEYHHFAQVPLSQEDLNETLKEALLGSKVGDTIDILIQTPNFAEPDKELTYKIYRVEGVLRDGQYLKETTLQVTENDTILISYSDGTTTSSGYPAVLYGVLDLSSDLPQAFKDALVGKSVMETFETPLLVPVTYAKGTADYTLELHIEELVATDSEGTELDNVTYGGYVGFTCVYYENGEELGEATLTLLIPSEEDYAIDENWTTYGYTVDSVYQYRTIIDALLNKTCGETVDEEGNSTIKITILFEEEYVHDFTLYTECALTYAISYDLNIAYSFTNEASVYYGKTNYVILEPEDKTLYGLDSNASYDILAIFQDLVGSETVKLGLDEEAMQTYGLYAYRVHYYMPYDCYGITDEDDNTDYYYKSKIGFWLYISETQADGSRYIGSDQFDLVCKYEDGSDFDFVEWDFATKWVQNNLLMVTYTDLRGLIFDLNFTEEEYNHVYAFDVCVNQEYEYVSSYYVSGEKVSYTTVLPRLFASYVDGGEHIENATYKDLRAVLQTKKTTNTDDYSKVDSALQIKTKAGIFVQTINSKLRYITELLNGTDLDEIYGYRQECSKNSYDGAYNLQSLLYILNTARYFGVIEDELTAEEIEELTSDPDNCVMTLAMTLCDSDYDVTGYTLRFYTYSTHTLVTITNEQTGEVAEMFYMQAREVVKIAKAVVALTKGEVIDIDCIY